MAKRLTDTEKWKKPWFRRLSPELKCFWHYILDNCTHAGIWNVDVELANYLIGTEINIETISEEFAKQYIEISNGSRWYIIDYIEFQYGKLSCNSQVHKSVIKALILEFGENYEEYLKGLARVEQPLPKGCSTLIAIAIAKDKDIDINKNIDIDINIGTPKKRESKKFVKPTQNEIEEYLNEKKITAVSAEKFYNYYESNGWRVGKNPMVNWKSAITTWKTNGYSNGNGNGTAKNNVGIAVPLSKLYDTTRTRV